VEESGFKIDRERFSTDFQMNFADQLRRRMKQQPSKRTSPATEIVLQSFAVAAARAVNAQSWPHNEPIEIGVSAHKETEFMRENIAKDPDLRNVRISPCLGSNLDFQARIGKEVLINAECELHGARQRAEDMEKLVQHEQRPALAVMVSRGMSIKETAGIRRSMRSKAEKSPDPVLIVTLDWKKNAPLSAANVTLDNSIGTAAGEQ
jgi:hypothetical protein